MTAPILETARLLLRPHRLDDFRDCAAMWADPVVTRYIGGCPLAAEESWTRLLRYAGHWSLLGFGYWVAEEKASGRLVGELGFADYQRDLEPRLGDMPEAGWVFSSGAHGKGYATEGVGAILAWGDSHFSHSEMACLIHPENVQSLRVAQKCGFRERLRTSYHGQPTILLTRSRRS